MNMAPDLAVKKKRRSSHQNPPKDIISLQKLHGRLDYILRRYKLWVIIFLFALTVVYIMDETYFPAGTLLPEPFLLGFFLIGITFLWIQEMRDRVILENMNKILTELDEMKTRFITIAGHELYTPLAIIKQYTELLKEKLLGELSPQQVKSLESISHSVERLYHIVNYVLLIKSIDFRKEKRVPRETKQWEKFDFRKLTEKVKADILPMVQRRQQNFEMEVEGSFQTMVADEEGIHQVLTNLLLNAIRFTPDGGKIRLHARETPNRYEIGVRDTGIGIAPEEKEKIFESFYEVKNPRYHSFGTIEFNSSGLGLGLTICKNIVESHGGKIWVDSRVGQYADFNFTIPKKLADAQVLPLKEPPRSFHFPGIRLKKTA